MVKAKCPKPATGTSSEALEPSWNVSQNGGLQKKPIIISPIHSQAASYPSPSGLREDIRIEQTMVIRISKLHVPFLPRAHSLAEHFQTVRTGAENRLPNCFILCILAKVG